VSSENLLSSKLGGAATQLRYLPRTWRLVRAAAGGWTPLWLALVVLQGVVPPAVVVLTRPAVDALALAVQTAGASGLGDALVLLGAMAGLLVAGEILHAACDWAAAVQAKRVEDHLGGLIHEQAVAVDLAFYEWPEFHDHLHRARDEARYRPVALLANAGALLQSLVTLAGMAAILATYGVWIALALVASTLPALAVLLRFALRQHRWRIRATADERRADYHDWVLTSSDAAAELRAFGLGTRLRAQYRALRSRLTGEQLDIARSQALAEAGASLVALAVAAACVAWMGWRAIDGTATLGDVALFYAAFTQGQRMMRTLLASVGMGYYNVLFLGNLFAYLDLRPTLVDRGVAMPAAAAREAPGLDVRLAGVTFRYPGASAPALKDLDLHVGAGEVAAIVGANGAGKSTLVKLLCRLYDPDAGRILLGGADLREMKLDHVREAVTVLFQDPFRFNETIAGNIALGREAAAHEIAKAARAAGADTIAARHEKGYETLLGRWFEGGVDVSVGEWQRIALARALLRRAPVIVLDEPTSALDPWTEAGWLDRFRAVAAGRTAIVITHRFSTAMRADVIFVMHEGRVDERGTHDELVARGGRYAASWHAQTRTRDDAIA
jgi:ATP-binding cassette subfamily B protein